MSFICVCVWGGGGRGGGGPDLRTPSSTSVVRVSQARCGADSRRRSGRPHTKYGGSYLAQPDVGCF